MIKKLFAKKEVEKANPLEQKIILPETPSEIQ